MTMRATHRKMNLARRGEQVGRIEVLEVGRLVGPAPRGERPERRAEPRIEHVGLAAQGRAAAVAGSSEALLRPRSSRRSLRPRNTRPVAGGPTRAGARCTRAAASPSSHVDPAPAFGHEAHAPVAHRSVAGSLSSSMRMNHCSEMSGSMWVPQRWQVPTRGCSPRPSRAPLPPAVGGDALTRLGDREPGVGPPSAVMRPSGPMAWMVGSLWSRPMSKSVRSWAGVILRAPVPNSGSTRSRRSPAERARAAARRRCGRRARVAGIAGVHGHRRVASMSRAAS